MASRKRVRSFERVKVRLPRPFFVRASHPTEPGPPSSTGVPGRASRLPAVVPGWTIVSKPAAWHPSAENSGDVTDGRHRATSGRPCGAEPLGTSYAVGRRPLAVLAVSVAGADDRGAAVAGQPRLQGPVRRNGPGRGAAAGADDFRGPANVHGRSCRAAQAAGHRSDARLHRPAPVGSAARHADDGDRAAIAHGAGRFARPTVQRVPLSASRESPTGRLRARGSARAASGTRTTVLAIRDVRGASVGAAGDR